MLAMLMYHRIPPQEHPEAVSVTMSRRQLYKMQSLKKGSLFLLYTESFRLDAPASPSGKGTQTMEQ